MKKFLDDEGHPVLLEDQSRHIHGCALEPDCPLLSMFAAPAVLAPVF